VHTDSEDFDRRTRLLSVRLSRFRHLLTERLRREAYLLSRVSVRVSIHARFIIGLTTIRTKVIDHRVLAVCSFGYCSGRPSDFELGAFGDEIESVR
jgi:hypothetical protein